MYLAADVNVAPKDKTGSGIIIREIWECVAETRQRSDAF